jgi:hypothetical protein
LAELLDVPPDLAALVLAGVFEILLDLNLIMRSFWTKVSQEAGTGPSLSAGRQQSGRATVVEG